MNNPYGKPVLFLVLSLLVACGGPGATDTASNQTSDTTSTAVGAGTSSGVSETTSSTAAEASGTDTSDIGSATTAAKVDDNTDDTSGKTTTESAGGDNKWCAGDLPVGAAAVDGYRQLELCGWQVFMNDDLYGDDLAETVYRELAEDLQMVIDVAPAPSVEFLRDTKIWLELDEPAFPGGVYHRSAQWLGDNGYPEKWAQGVQFGNARNFLDWPAQQPAMLLHEFTHALHDQKYGFGQPDVASAYDSAMQAGLYDSVEYVDGGLQEAYAATNSIEYLAELSEAYFWKNDFYPFDRKDLAEHDPTGLATVESIWQVG